MWKIHPFSNLSRSFSIVWPEYPQANRSEPSSASLASWNGSCREILPEALETVNQPEWGRLGDQPADFLANSCPSLSPHRFLFDTAPGGWWFPFLRVVL